MGPDLAAHEDTGSHMVTIDKKFDKVVIKVNGVDMAIGVTLDRELALALNGLYRRSTGEIR